MLSPANDSVPFTLISPRPCTPAAMVTLENVESPTRMLPSSAAKSSSVVPRIRRSPVPSLVAATWAQQRACSMPSSLHVPKRSNEVAVVSQFDTHA